MDSDFDLFDFAREQENVPLPQETETPVPAAPAPLKILSKAELRQAAMAFLATLKPAGIAANVPTRRSKYRVAAAGFWRPENHRKNHTVTKTAIVVMYDDLDCCFSDCATRDERISAITKLQEEKEALEADIRQNEPHLASADDLFGDFRTWDYASSNNTAYRKEIGRAHV